VRTARHLPNPPPQFLASSQLSPEATFLLWHGLAPTTRKGYESAVNHYESFTRLCGLKPYPATIYNLTAWIASAIIKTKAKTTKQYLQGLRSYHIEMGYNIAEFNDPRLERVIRGGKRYHGDVGRCTRLPITWDILVKILGTIPDTCDGINLKASLCLGFSAFLRLGEFTYDRWEESSPNFLLTRSLVTFETDGNISLFLPASKTDYFRKGVHIPLASTPSITCPVSALQKLFKKFPTLPTAPLFAHTFGPFSRDYIVKSIRYALLNAGINPSNFSGHSLHRGTAISAVEAGIPHEDIKVMG